MECIVRDIPIHYEEMGAGRPLLMLHGWSLDHRFMTYNMEPLFEHRPGWRRLYLDMPGMGRTPGADWITCQDDMLKVALEFLDAIAPGERFAVAGVSLGGYLARGIVYQRREQIDGMLLWVPVIESDYEKRTVPPHNVLVLDSEFVDALEADDELALELAVVQSLEGLAAYRASVKPGNLVADYQFLERVSANYGFSFDVDKLTEPCPAPSLIMAGRQDTVTGYQDAWSLLDNFPRGTFAVLDRAGHLLQDEQKVLFRALVSEWLDRVEEYAAKG
jgi:pimeloyl-ACP methyl ester carboxylesterase